MTDNIISAGLSHVGLIAKQNEDFYVCDEQLGLYIVADGMGGHAAGEIASKLAAQTIADNFRNTGSLVNAANQAHSAVLKAIDTDRELSGMGTTIVAAHVNSELEYEIAWVGDSRCYHWSTAACEQITSDHSFMQALLASGKFDLEQASRHPEAKSLTQAIGVSLDMAPQVATVSGRLEPEEYLLLCSDGLTDELSRADINELINTSDKPQQICTDLIDAALREGGRDNITVILIGAAADTVELTHDDEHEAVRTQSAESSGKKLFTWLASSINFV